MAAEALIPALIQALGLGAAGTAAKGTMDMLKEKDEAKLGNPEASIPGKNTVEAIKNGFANKLDKHKQNTLLVDLVAGGLSSKDAQEIAKTGFITEEMIDRLDENGLKALESFIGEGVPQETRDKLMKQSDEDIDNQLGNNKNNRNPKDAAEKAAKAKALKELRDKYKKWAKEEKNFISETSRKNTHADNLNIIKDVPKVEKETSTINAAKKAIKNIDGERALQEANTPEARGLRNMKNNQRKVDLAKNTNDSASRFIWENADSKWQYEHPEAMPPK